MSTFNEPGSFMVWANRVQGFALFCFSAFVSFSIAGAHISLGLLALIVLIKIVLRRRAATSAPPALVDWRIGIEWPLAVFAAIALASTLVSESPLESFIHCKHLLTALGAYAVAYTLREHPQWRRPSLYVFVITAAFAAIVGLAKYLVGMTIRVQGSQAITMTWGAMCAMIAIVTLQLAVSETRRAARWTMGGLLVPQLAALLLSFVRGAYLGFAAGVLYLVRRQWRRPLPVVAIIVVVTLIFAPAAVKQRITSIVDLQNPTVLVRLTQWKIAARVIADHPILGVGWIDLAATTQEYAKPDPSLPEAVNHDVFFIGHYHNTFVTLAVYFGLLGFASFLWLIIRLWRQLRAAQRMAESGYDALMIQAALAVIIAFLVSGMFDWTFGDAEVVTMFWYLVGIGIGHSSGMSEQVPEIPT